MPCSWNRLLRPWIACWARYSRRPRRPPCGRRSWRHRNNGRRRDFPRCNTCCSTSTARCIRQTPHRWICPQYPWRPWPAEAALSISAPGWKIRRAETGSRPGSGSRRPCSGERRHHLRPRLMLPPALQDRFPRRMVWIPFPFLPALPVPPAWNLPQQSLFHRHSRPTPRGSRPPLLQSAGTGQENESSLFVS